MSRHVGVVCAGALLVAAAGCLPDRSLVGPGGPVGGVQVVAGSVTVVSAQLQTGLSDAGISVLSKRQGGVVRLVGMTRSGKVFSILLRGDRVQGGDQTTVALKWDREPDEEFWQTVVGLLAESHPPADKDAGE